MMIRPTRGSAPLQLTILLLVLYIIHLHWTSPEAPLSPLSSLPSSSRLLSPQPLSPQPLSSPSVTSNNGPKNIVLSTDKANWSKSRNGPENVGIFVRPVYPQPKGMRIAIATMNTDETTYDHISLSNKFGYARKHNYAIKLDLEMPRDLVPMAVWHKLNMIEYLIRTEEYDWIWWIDYDTVITNTDIKLEDIIKDVLKGAKNPDDIDLILTADCWPLNAGSMIIRASPRMFPFISAVWECGNTPKEPSEQDCIRDVVTKAPMSTTFRSRAIWIPQTKINAFPEEVPCFDENGKGWKPRDFVAHFAGAWAHLPAKLKKDSYGVLMRKYSEWVDKTELNGNERWQVLDKQGPQEEDIEIQVDTAVMDAKEVEKKVKGNKITR